MTKSSDTKLKTVRLKSNVVEKLEQMAQNENRNFNNMVETILMQATQRI